MSLEAVHQMSCELNQQFESILAYAHILISHNSNNPASKSGEETPQASAVTPNSTQNSQQNTPLSQSSSSSNSPTANAQNYSLLKINEALNRFNNVSKKLDTVIGQLKPFNKCLNCCSIANIDTSLAQTPVYSDSNKMIRWITSMQDIRAENSTFLHSIWPNFSQKFYSHSKQVSVDEICSNLHQHLIMMLNCDNKCQISVSNIMNNISIQFTIENILKCVLNVKQNSDLIDLQIYSAEEFNTFENPLSLPQSDFIAFNSIADKSKSFYLSLSCENDFNLKICTFFNWLIVLSTRIYRKPCCFCKLYLADGIPTLFVDLNNLNLPPCHEKCSIKFKKLKNSL